MPFCQSNGLTPTAAIGKMPTVPKGPVSKEAAALGEAIRARRLRAGLTQKVLARAAGIDVTDLSRFETGRREPHPIQLRAIARALATSPSRLARAWDDPAAHR